MKKRKLLFITSLILMLTLGFIGCVNQGASTSAEGGEQSHEEHHDHDDNYDGQSEDHAHGQYEWMGEYELKAGTYLFHFGPSEDETMDVGFIKLGDNVVDLEHHAEHLMATDKEVILQDSTFEAKPDYAYTLEMIPDHGYIHFTILEDGTYAIATEHLPEECNMQIFDENEKEEILPIKEYESGHSH